MSFKPTLAVAADFSKIRYPVYASPKLDGIRASVVNSLALTRSLKRIPNPHVNTNLSKLLFNGLDGELIVGEPTSKTVYRDTVSSVMRMTGQPEFSYYVFDNHMAPGAFESRLEKLVYDMPQYPIWVRFLEQRIVHTEATLLHYEAEQLEKGYEGLIIGRMSVPYEFGRSTVGEGYMLKVKRFVDGEAEIIRTEEEMFNGNEAQTNELGRTKRSTAKDGLVGKGTMGALVVRDLVTGIEFNIGTGFDAADRAADIWQCGRIVKYKHFPIGSKDKPRHPVFLGFRDARDMS